MPRIPWWTLLSSGCAPLALIGGWVMAQQVQPPGYDPVTQTISSLAAYGATDRWLMTTALVVLGLCDTVTACGLRALAPAGRIALACGGAASILVALSPEPAGGASLRHIAATAAGFTALAAWPCLTPDRRRDAPWTLRPVFSASVTAVLLVGAAWFLVELHDHGAAGIAERVLTAAQAVWPLTITTHLRLSHPETDSAAPESDSALSTSVLDNQLPENRAV